MKNAEIARILGEIADLLEMTGGSPFKVRAYRTAAQIIDLHPGPVADVWRAGLGGGAFTDAGELREAVLNTLPVEELRRKLARRTTRRALTTAR